MRFKTPSFWYRDPESQPALAEKLLAPLAFLYRIGYEIHQRSKKPRSFDIPILCIGNINAGGTGKTPTALALMDVIRKNKIAANPFFLLRGYGGGDPGPLLVEPAKHTAWNTGDEALLLAAKAPTIVSVDRAAGAELAIRKQSDFIVMDDGLQNPGIKKDIQIIVVNGDMGFGNGKMMPAGPLREPLQHGFKKADAYILIGEDKLQSLSAIPAAKPVFRAKLAPDEATLPPKDRKYLAFAGLGYPGKFFSFLKQDLGLNIAGVKAFADHYPYQDSDLQNLREQADALGAALLTTEKDFLRLPPGNREGVHTVRVHLVWEDENALAQFIRERLQKAT